MADTYTLRVELSSPDKVGRSLLAEAVDEVIRWLESALVRSGSKLPNILDYPLSESFSDGIGGTLAFDGETGSTWEYWRLRWEHPDYNGRPIRWLTDIRLATVGEVVEFDLLVRAAIQPAAVLPVHPHADPPRVVPLILERFTAKVLGWRVDAQAVRANEQNIDGIIDSILLDQARTIPVVLITWNPATRMFAVDSERLSSRLAGLAVVVVLEDVATTFRLTDRLGRAFSCFGGAVRVYWPGLDIERDSPFKHRLWLSERLASLEISLERLLVNDFSPAMEGVLAGRERTWDQAVRQANESRKLEFDKLRQAILEGDAAQALLGGAGAQIGKYLVERADLYNLIEELERQKRDLETENDALRQNLWLVAEGEPETEELEAYGVDDFKSVADALEAATRLSGVRFLPSARKSAEDSPYSRPMLVYHNLLQLSELAKARNTGAIGGHIEGWLVARRVRFAPRISQTSATNWRTDYEFTDGDTKVFMEEHLLLGSGFDPRSCLRIHMIWDPNEGGYVVGWVGRHLTNTKT